MDQRARPFRIRAAKRRRLTPEAPTVEGSSRGTSGPGEVAPGTEDDMKAVDEIFGRKSPNDG